MRRALSVLAILAIGSLTACTSTSSAVAKPGTCLTPLTASSSGPAGSLPAAASVAPSGKPLPKLSLDCLDGSGKVPLPTLDRPAIISFWATYCGPCQEELPKLAAFAQSAGDRIAVIGVDTADEASKGRSMAADLGLMFPMLSDPNTTFFKMVSAPGMPTLLFVTPGGHIAYSLSSNTVDETVLRTLSAKYLDVTVP